MTTRTYRAEFFTAADYAVRNFEARTPQEALALARRFYDEDIAELDFRSYDDNAGLDEIDIWDRELGTLASWESDNCRLRRAARELLAALRAQTEAAKAVVAHWQQGDLAGAVRTLDASVGDAEDAIAKAAPVEGQAGDAS